MPTKFKLKGARASNEQAKAMNSPLITRALTSQTPKIIPVTGRVTNRLNVGSMVKGTPKPGSNQVDSVDERYSGDRSPMISSGANSKLRNSKISAKGIKF